jgi:hypothetical protein
MKIKSLFFLGLICLALGCKTMKKLEQNTKQGLEGKLGMNKNPATSGTGTPGGTGTAVAGGAGISGSSGMSGSSSPGSNGGSGGSNSGGAGLISTPPDVKQNLTDAENAYNKTNLSDARYAVQQAMLGVELEIGNQILKSFPSSIAGLDPDKKQDQVTSTGFGWAGLTIHRIYRNSGGKYKGFEINVVNNAAMMSALNMYLSSGGFAQQTGGQQNQNWKQIRFKGNRAIIDFSNGSGYKLSVPLGQSSLIVLNGKSFDTENDMMDACNLIDVDGIKKMLGEQ